MSQPTRPDPTCTGAFRRLRYERGQLLCAAQFQAEQSYFRQRDDLANLTLHGSGTVSGLKLGLQGNALTVSPGLAVDGTGRFLRVASLVTVDVRGGGTTGAGAGVQAIAGGASGAQATGGPITRYVVLEPADVDDGAYVCERSAVRLRGAPPDDQATGLARSFARLMSRVVPAPCGTVTVATICDLVRNLSADGSSGDCCPLEVVPQQLQAVWEAAVRTYVTEVAGRPDVDPTQHTPAGGVLLGTVRFRPGSAVELSEEGRPVLAPTMLLQECLSTPSPTAAPPAPAPWPWPPWPYGPYGAANAQTVSGESATPPPPAAAYRPVGAGQITVESGQVTRVDATGFGLADVVPEGNQIYRIGFAGFQPQSIYIVKGTPVTTDTAPPSTLALLAPSGGGVRVKVTNSQNGAGIIGFQVEIVQVLS